MSEQGSPFDSEISKEGFNSAEEYSEMTPSVQGYNEAIPRTARDLDLYKKAFGPEFGSGDELILDVGSGDSSAADEILSLDNHNARVIKLDVDYVNTPPPGEAPAVAADAAHLPLAGSSIDRVVSLWMLPHLDTDKAAASIGEMLRVLKPAGQALLFPAAPHRSVKVDFAHKQASHFRRPRLPTLVITKPDDYDTWDSQRRAETEQKLARYVTLGTPLYQLDRFLFARQIERVGTKRTIEAGHMYVLKKPKSDLPPSDTDSA